MGDLRGFEFGDFRFDPGGFRLLQGDRRVAVEPKALDVLAVLVERAPRMVEKRELLAIAWKQTAVTDNALTRVIAQLRRALGDDPRSPRYIETVATRGYRFLAQVRLLEAGAAAEADAPPPPIQAAPRVARGPLWRAVAVTLAGLLIAALLVATRHPRPVATRSGPSPLATNAVGILAALQPQRASSGSGYDGFVAFSPDGRSYAFSSDRTGAFEIFVQGLAEGSTPMQLTSNGRHNVQPSWSPDGERIAYHEMAGGGIWIVPSRGGAARSVSSFGSAPSWSPDGRLIAFQSATRGDLNPAGGAGGLSTIAIVPADGRRQPTRLTELSRPAGSHVAPAWWPNGQRLLFAVARRAGAPPRTELWTIELTGGDLRRVSENERLTAEFAPSPEGDGVLFSARGTHGLWWLPWDGVGPADPPRPTALPVTGAQLAQIAIAPGGRRVAWTALDSKATIQAVSAAAGSAPAATPVALVDDVGWRAGYPVISRDGRLAFMGSRSGARNAIYALAANGSSRQVTTDAPDHGGPAWLDGGEIACIADHGDGASYWAADPDSGRERLLFRLDALRPPPGTEPFSAAPAAGVALDARASRLAMAFVADGVPNLWTIALGPQGPVGSFVQRTFEAEGGSYGSWSPDGRELAYQCAEQANVHLCVAGERPGERRRLTHDPGLSFIGGWSPDGRHILLASRRRAVWNVAAVSSATGELRTLTAFREPRAYVRYPRWDAARDRVVFERFETKGLPWLVELPGASE